MLTGAVLALCSFAPPLPNNTDRPAKNEPRDSRAVRIFEKHQLALRDSIVRVALAQVGTPYEFGGATPDEGFDCSGLVRYVFSQLYLTPPRLADKQARIGAAVGRDRLRPGDLVTFGAGDSVTHIGIYVGERKFVHASVSAGRVIVSSIENPHSDLIQVLKGGRRLLAIAEPTEQRIGGS
jgi:cell wall-associated NlpC family hydrolase